MSTKIAGLWSGHDCSFCILDDGRPTIHAELERYIREKEPKGDSVSFMRDVFGVENDVAMDEIDHLTTCYPELLLRKYE